MPKRVRTPNCTHVDMDRVYTRELQCYVCGRSPSVGFLYECRQDCDFKTLRDQLAQDEDRIEPVKSDLRLQLEATGFSESIILTAEGGHYTNAQLTKLKGQKAELRQIILDVEQKTEINDAVAKLTSIDKASTHNDGALNSTPAKDETAPGCAFKACHNCRPYYRDRVYISFHAVLSADFAPITHNDAQQLPIKSSQVMRNIGNTVHSFSSSLVHATTLSTLPTSTSFATSTEAPQTASTASSDSSELTFKTTQTDMDEITAQRRPRRRFYKMGHRNSGDIAHDLSRLPAFLTRQGLKSAVQGIFRTGRDSSSSGSNVTLPLARTGTVRNLNESESVGEFDLGALRRVRRQKERNELRNGTYRGGFEGVIAKAHATGQHAVFASSHSRDDTGTGADETSSSESDFSVYSCASEGSEVEVEGGVALTEEAVETHTPDILAVDVPDQKLEASMQSVEMDEEDGMGADIGLQSIMAQV
ncbi:uncharacterized protein K460DRAFT_392445 [Cucurbitaria berberidis CBS 394.84]|uniref:Uncharacterized protein n=1 Tax=Cucurbitaria berberidis CBS 394.84 TaxID=1168544 RepID=A0A9P4GKR2_9PLEO|nr:uncharacterized protein K460DRAFT_392445 [Cucurbitaria berberidis CBS 394.84]KAF1846984.1 hypothetical protein K460DRAFT_392445 [Cucurbitaria berberidis CBS 394.84]